MFQEQAFQEQEAGSQTCFAQKQGGMLVSVCLTGSSAAHGHSGTLVSFIFLLHQPQGLHLSVWSVPGQLLILTAAWTHSRREELDSPGFKASSAAFRLCDLRHFLSEPADRAGCTLVTWPHLAAHVPGLGLVVGQGGPAKRYAKRLVHTLDRWLSWLEHPP